MLKLSALAAAAAVLALTASASFAAPDAGFIPQRTILQTTDVPGSNYTVILAVSDIPPNVLVARHTHPGIEVSYVLAGEIDFTIEGIGLKHFKAGDSFRLESGVRHSVQNGSATTRILAVYTTPKGAELATPAPE